jgi:hypothetical protein
MYVVFAGLRVVFAGPHVVGAGLQVVGAGPLVEGGGFGAALVVLIYSVSLSPWESRAVENADVHRSSVLYKARIKIKSHKSITRRYGWIPHNASFGFLDLAPSILHSNWFWDYIS